MDERTPFAVTDAIREPSRPRRFARISIRTIAGVILMLAVAAVGFRLGRDGRDLSSLLPESAVVLLGGSRSDQTAPPSGPVIYYRDPDGKRAYSSEPRSTPDGRAFVAVHASEDVSFDEPRTAAAPAAETKRVLYYRNPMGLPDTSPVPKKDSMGMDYLPVYEGEDADDGSIRLSLGKVQRTGVRSEPVTRRPVVRKLRIPGTVKLDERRVTVVSMRADSFIERVENVTTGDRVKKGQRLLEVFSPEVNAAAAQLISNPGFEGSRRRLENLDVPPDVIAEMERTRKVPLTIAWTAPRDGIVLERNATDGMKAASGQVLFRLADISTIWVLADVPEEDIGNVVVGEEVAIRLRSLSGRVFPGRVAVIYPQVNTDTRTVRIRIEIANGDGALLPEMYADVDVVGGAGSPVLAVPDSALMDTGTRQVVIVDKGDGRFEPREVKVGRRGEDFVEIREGIEEGDRVVVSANFLIDAESNLKAALKGMTNSEAAR
jgi:Cu(I)/Ag(I) efflux system membrane fusion protein